MIDFKSDLKRLASVMPTAYKRFDEAFKSAVDPVEKAANSIRVKYTSKNAHVDTGEDGKAFPAALGIDRVRDNWRVVLVKTGFKPLPLSDAPIAFKLAALELMDKLVEEYTEHVAKERRALLRCYGDDAEAE